MRRIKKINDTDWQINFETTVLNTDYADCFVKVESSILDCEGNYIVTGTSEGSVKLRDKNKLTYSAVVKNLLLWDCDNPNLYTVKTVLIKNDEIIDENITRIGFRTVEISATKGLLLNGKKCL